MRQRLSRRLEELERIATAAAARRSEESPGYKQKIEALVERARAWIADPVNQEWLAAQSPDYLHNRVQALRAKMWERAQAYCREAV